MDVVIVIERGKFCPLACRNTVASRSVVAAQLLQNIPLRFVPDPEAIVPRILPGTTGGLKFHHQLVLFPRSKFVDLVQSEPKTGVEVSKTFPIGDPIPVEETYQTDSLLNHKPSIAKLTVTLDAQGLERHGIVQLDRYLAGRRGFAAGTYDFGIDTFQEYDSYGEKDRC